MAKRKLQQDIGQDLPLLEHQNSKVACTSRHDAEKAAPEASKTGDADRRESEPVDGTMAAKNKDFVDPICARLHGVYYRQAYRMTPDHFWRLYELLSPYMPRTEQNTLRISVALRFFAGGDSAADHDIKDTKLLNEYFWDVVDAINKCDEMDINFPTVHLRQREKAAGFELFKSDAEIDSCVGSIGHHFIWIQKPSGIDAEDYYCETREKYGFRLQAVCDHAGRFLDVYVDPHGPSTAVDTYLESLLGEDVAEKGLLADGLALFGNEEYAGCPFIVTPMVDNDDTDAALRQKYNKYQNQLSGIIDTTFVSLIQRWALLRRALPATEPVSRQKDLVVALCKMHNFCLDDTEPMLPGLAKDMVYGFCHGAVLTNEKVDKRSPARELFPLDSPALVKTSEIQQRLVQKVQQKPNTDLTLEFLGKDGKQPVLFEKTEKATSAPAKKVHS